MTDSKYKMVKLLSSMLRNSFAMTLKNLLLPTDFTSYSKNAIQYGIQLANKAYVKEIILLHVYNANNQVTNQTIISASIPEMLQDKQSQLDRLKESIISQTSNEVHVSTLLVEGRLLQIVHDLILRKQIDLVIMGLSNKTKLEQTLVSSNTINVMKKTTCPVIIVPDNAQWIDNPIIAAAIDISHDTRLIPIEKVQSVVQQLQASKLLLVNVDDEDDHNAHIQNPNIDKINFAFKDSGSKLDILSFPNKLKAIESFCSSKTVSLLILFERKYGILETIFHKSLTRQLAFQSHTPILVIEELS